MPRTIEKTVYTFDELDERAKDRAIQKYREMSAHDAIHKHIYEDAKTCFEFCGFADLEIQYSGFSCQGDGASFVGTWSAADVKPGQLKQHAPQDEELAALDDEFAALKARYPSMTATITRTDSHYCHEHTVTAEAACYNEDNDPINGFVYESPHWKLMETAGLVVADEFEELARRCMRWIYKQLEKEYDYQTSDEHIIDMIEANEMEFDENGDS